MSLVIKHEEMEKRVNDFTFMAGVGGKGISFALHWRRYIYGIP
jgi:hypothetical protein